MSDGGFANEAVKRMQMLMEDLSAHLRDRRLSMADDDLQVMEEAVHQLRKGLQTLGSTKPEDPARRPQAVLPSR